MTSQETYTHGHHESVVLQHAMRTADEAAAFLRSHVRPGMRLLDMGCGPGSITIGLADWVAPGEVVGIDLDEATVARAREMAESRSVLNVEFRQGSVYELPFNDAEFDVVYAHQLLQHLGDPAAALTESMRVLKPSGIFAVRDVDWGSTVLWPQDRLLDRFLDIYYEVARRNGGDAHMGRRIRSLMLEAGYADVDVSSSVWTFATTERTAQWGNQWRTRTLQSNLGQKAVEYGIASQSEIEEVAGAWAAWGQKPDAYMSFVHGQAIGWKK